VVWLRLATSTVVLLAWARPVLRGRTWAQWWPALGLGVCLATMNWSIYESFARLPLGVAVTIELAGPLVLAAFSATRRRDLGWIAVAAAGVVLLGVGPGEVTAAGVGFAVLAGAAWAGYILCAKATGSTWSGLDGLAVASAVALVILSVPVLGWHTADLGHAQLWWIGAAVGLLSSVVPYSAEMIALRSLSPTVFGVLVSLDPAAAALAGLAVVGETLAPYQWLAIVCVVIASIGMTRAGGGYLAEDDEPAPSTRLEEPPGQQEKPAGTG
jgi:inner membrane transporter RhtA